VAYSPDGRLLAAPAEDPHDLVLRDADTYEVRATLHGHAADLTAASFQRDGSRLVTASLDGTLRVWDVATGQQVWLLRGHAGPVLAAAYSPDGTRIASGGQDRLLRLWDAATGEEMIRLAGHAEYICGVAFSPDGETIATGSGDFTVRLWDTFPLARRLRAREEAAALRPEAERLAAQLLQGGADPSEVVRHLQEDPGLGEPLRRATWLAVLRRVAGPH
jgi:WD40 repeat protein